MELHRARFVEWTPAAVAAMAPTADGRALAVGRDDGCIELYDVAADWRCALRIPGCEGASITTLLWCEEAAGSSGAAAAAAAPAPRLFSAGLSGQIVEWDLQALRPLAATDSTGGPVWHMSARAHEPSGAPQVRARLAARLPLRFRRV
jgi:U3 small nucleolar RNA-associated protein 4